VLGGYWLQRLGKSDESMRFMKEGLKNNPDSASISAAIGNLYFRMHKAEEALRYLERARKLWAQGRFPNNTSDKYSLSDRYFALDLLGDIYEKEKRYPEALKIYQEAYGIQSSDAILKKVNRIRGQL
jgi:tetratricopeptide (TPR) repeat protein